MYFFIFKSVKITEIIWITEYMCRYMTQPGLLTALLEYLTVLLEYLDRFNLNLFKNYPDSILNNRGYG